MEHGGRSPVAQSLTGLCSVVELKRPVLLVLLGTGMGFQVHFLGLNGVL